MQIAKHNYSAHFFQPNTKDISKSEKVIAIIHAIFEGMGLAGIISAAFWYATAPIAPNGFQGPIATFTIAITAIASLFFAIPIAYVAYKRLIHNLKQFFADLFSETKCLDQNIEELYFELLQLRALFNHDNEFLSEMKSITQSKITEIAIDVCQIYSKVKNKRYTIKWDAGFSLSLAPNEKTYHIHSAPFVDLLKDKELTSIKAFRTAMINCLSLHMNKFQFDQPVPAQRLKSIIYAIVAAITCSEVFLSIGWTVASILIGIKVMTPIPMQTWIVFATSCLVIGPLFGVGVYMGNSKQTKRDLLKEQIHYQNTLLADAIENSSLLFAKQLLEQRKIVNNKTHLNANFNSVKMNTI